MYYSKVIVIFNVILCKMLLYQLGCPETVEIVDVEEAKRYTVD